MTDARCKVVQTGALPSIETITGIVPAQGTLSSICMVIRANVRVAYFQLMGKRNLAAATKDELRQNVISHFRN